MGNKRQNSSLLLVWVQALSLGLGTPAAVAEPRALTAIQPLNSIVSKVDKTLVSSILAPTPLKSEDQFYRQYVASVDGRIEREYMDRWYFHELQASYGTRRTQNQKHISPGTLEFHDNAPNEIDYRKAFAMQVLQIRAQKTVEEYLKSWKGMKSIEKTVRALDIAKSQSISFVGTSKVSGPAATPSPFLGDLRFGYDIFYDFSKVEYSCRALDFGFYHTMFVSSLAGSSTGNLRSFYSQLVVKTSEQLPTPSVRYRFEAKALDFGVSKALTKKLSGSLATTQPITNGGTPSSYGVSFAYSF